MDIQTRRLRTIEQLCAFVEGNPAVEFQPQGREEAYRFVCEILTRFGYRQLGKRDTGIVLRFLLLSTRFSRPQLERLVRQWRQRGAIRDRRGERSGKPFTRKYTPADIRLLAEIDQAFGQMSGPATREILRRQYAVYGGLRFVRLATLSSHLYNLRHSA